MANITKIKLPTGNTYTIKDDNALPLTGGTVTGPVNFDDSVSIDEVTIGDLVVNGNGSFTNNIQANTINEVAVGTAPKFTDTVTTATTSGSGNAVTAITASNGALTVTKGTTFLTSHQDISGKADKSATVSTVAWDSTNKKITKTINGTTSDVVTTATLKSAIGSASTSNEGLMTTAQVIKLNGIATGAEVNQNAFSNVKVGSTTVAADAKTDTLELAAGSNVTLTPDATNDKVTIAATDTTYSVATSSTAGLMSASDKTKLDDISGSTLDIVAGSNISVTPNTTAGTLTIASTIDITSITNAEIDTIMSA